MKFLDVFAGIGGFHRGIVKSLGNQADCVGAVEWDKKARENYSENFPDVPLWGDVTKINYEELPDFDLICGGFPCQSFSIARNKNNKSIVDPSDERAMLYKSLLKICEVKKPKYILFENVARLAVMTLENGEKLIDVIINELNDLGYKVVYKVLDAKNFGVPQQRKRVFILGSLDHSKNLTIPESNGKTSVLSDILESGVNGKHMLHTQNWGKTPMKFEDGTRFDKLIANYDRGTRTPDQINRVSLVDGDTPSGLSRQRERLYSIHGISPCLTTFHPIWIDQGTDDPQQWRQVTGREMLRIQGFPDCHTIHKDVTKQTGNAVCVNVVESIINANF